MELTPKIQKAINFASRLHLGQTRKGDNSPYISHPVSVAFILSGYTEDEDIISAGLLHDVLEDVHGYTFANLAKDFGGRVAGIVKELTEDKDPVDSKEKDKQTWQYRKKKYVEDLRNDSPEALLVCYADKLHNLDSLITSYQEKGEKTWEVFNAPEPKKENSLWFYEEVFKVLKEKLDNDILVKYQEALLKTKELFK